MSFSTTTQKTIVPSIVNQKFSWQSKNNTLVSYDIEKKEKTEIKQQRFFVLDILTCISGFNEEYDSGIYSNEITDITKEELVVFTTDKTNNKKIKLAEGLYNDIKDPLKYKYAKSIYALLLNSKNEITEGIPINLLLSGATLSEFINKKITCGSVFEISTNTNELKKGSNKYFLPTYTIIPSDVISENVIEQAKIIDEALQSNFTERKYANSEAPTSQATTYDPNPAPVEPPALKANELPDLEDIQINMPF